MNVRHDGGYDYLFKIILVGDVSVGKTNLLSRYIHGKLPMYDQNTIGVEFTAKPVTVENGSTVKAQIWDTAGSEKFRAITTAHYRKSVGALIVFDLTQRSSYNSVQRWIQEIKEHVEPSIIIMLVGNKLDLCPVGQTTR